MFLALTALTLFHFFPYLVVVVVLVVEPGGSLSNVRQIASQWFIGTAGPLERSGSHRR